MIGHGCNIFEAMSGFAMPLAVLLYLMAYRKMRPRDVSKSLGLSRRGFTLRNIGIGVLLFIAILFVEVVVSVISVSTHTTINTNTGIALAGAPLWFYIFVAFIEPINEEILFRGFLVARLGIIISAVLFALGHSSYNSTFAVDVFAALIFGLLSGYVFKKTNSIYPSALAHILVNLLAVLVFLPI